MRFGVPGADAESASAHVLDDSFTGKLYAFQIRVKHFASHGDTARYAAILIRTARLFFFTVHRFDCSLRSASPKRSVLCIVYHATRFAEALGLSADAQLRLELATPRAKKRIEDLRSERDKHFDPKLVDIFVKKDVGRTG